jgi:hypothetical protein
MRLVLKVERHLGRSPFVSFSFFCVIQSEAKNPGS